MATRTDRNGPVRKAKPLRHHRHQMNLHPLGREEVVACHVGGGGQRYLQPSGTKYEVIPKSNPCTFESKWHRAWDFSPRMFCLSCFLQLRFVWNRLGIMNLHCNFMNPNSSSTKRSCRKQAKQNTWWGFSNSMGPTENFSSGIAVS